MLRGFSIGERNLGPEYEPLVIAEIGINHEGDIRKAFRMIDDAHAAGCECVKFQCHVIEDEMIRNNVIPGNATESIWDIMSRCALSEEEDIEVKRYAEQRGLLYLSTPFSRAAAVRLERMGVKAYKIGSGECNNYPLIEHVASYGKPMLLSTGMNDVNSIKPAVDILRRNGVPYALFHCTSIYPTPYSKVHLGALRDLGLAFEDAVVGLSDHSIGNYTAFAAVALGASLIEKHFTSDRSWPGPDNGMSLNPAELMDLLKGVSAVFRASGGKKEILPEEQPTIAFAYACVVSTKPIKAGEAFTRENIWVKRPGTGEILAAEFPSILGKQAVIDIPADEQVQWKWIK